MIIETVIVDDEAPIRDEIEFLLKNQVDFPVVASFEQPFDALSYIIEKNPKLVFLDINMPGASGLELAKKISRLPSPPLIVFVTAYPEHALEAFETSAVGYITKPVTEEKIVNVLNKIRSLVSPIPGKTRIQTNKLCALNNGKIIPINKEDISLIYVKEKDVYIRTKQHEYSSIHTLQEIEKILIDEAPGHTNFYRVHRQFIVNLDKILEIIPWFKGNFSLKMDDCKLQQVPVSRNKVKKIKEIMGLK